MSKLSKFIEHPKWFYKDAFKRRKSIIIHNIENINRQFKNIGIPFQLDIDNIERKFVKSAVQLTHNQLSSRILQIVNNRLSGKTQQIGFASPLQVLRNQIDLPNITIKHSFEISINPLMVQETNNLELISDSHKISDPDAMSNVKANVVIPTNLPARAKKLYELITTERYSVSHGVA